jgi:hypothetical protein
MGQAAADAALNATADSQPNPVADKMADMEPRDPTD